MENTETLPLISIIVPVYNVKNYLEKCLQSICGQTYKNLEIPYMRGILGQYIFAIPELNAVVVRLGHKRSDTRTSQHYPDDIDTWLGAAMEIIQKSNNKSE